MSLCFADPQGILHLLTKLHDPDGIRAGHLLDAIKLCAPRVVERWLIIRRECQTPFPLGEDSWNLGAKFKWQPVPEISVILGAFPEGQNTLVYDGCCGGGGAPMRERLAQGFTHDEPNYFDKPDIAFNEIDL
jgi:hypothetical protein